MNICLDLSECNGIGDLLCATPAIEKISKSYETKILVLSKFPELFKLNPYVLKSYKTASVDHDYIKKHYVVHNSFYNVGKKNELGIEYKHNMIDIRQYHEANLGFMLTPDEMDCYYRPTEAIRQDIIPKKKYVVIHPVQSWDSRTWSLYNWELLSEKLVSSGFDVVAIGKDQSETGFFNVKKPVLNVTTDKVINLMNKTSISDCWHLINSCECIITMDSGILHLAGTTKSKIIHLGSSINPYYRIPYRNGKQHENYEYISGSCKIMCASDMKYGVKVWGNIQGVPPLIGCLENKKAFECHPSVEQVLEKI